jgi:hypothetical protein
MERRLSALETEVAGLKRRLANGASGHWAKAIFGVFANDPAFREVIRLGREYRRSSGRNKAKARKADNGRAGHRSR